MQHRAPPLQQAIVGSCPRPRPCSVIRRPTSYVLGQCPFRFPFPFLPSFSLLVSFPFSFLFSFPFSLFLFPFFFLFPFPFSLFPIVLWLQKVILHMRHVQRQRLVQRTNAVSYYPKILIPNCPMSRGRKIVVHLRIVRVRKIVQRRKCAVSNCSEILISFVRCRGAGSILFTFDLSACGYFKNHHSIFDIRYSISVEALSFLGVPRGLLPMLVYVALLG